MKDQKIIRNNKTKDWVTPLLKGNFEITEEDTKLVVDYSPWSAKEVVIDLLKLRKWTVTNTLMDYPGWSVSRDQASYGDDMDNTPFWTRDILLEYSDGSKQTVSVKMAGVVLLMKKLQILGIKMAMKHKHWFWNIQEKEDCQ